jgi:uncharacterized protein YyaL (SSP411 family)
MKRLFRAALALAFIFAAPAGASGLELTNQLKAHPSPYLAQHGSDPVAWQEWGDAVFERALAENKLVYVSVGYFSCHWCHVMQRESYNDSRIASQLNKDFIPVKVDRELEPALDDALMAFVQRTQGRGGWPLNVFLTPEGYPLYAVLYVPPDSFAQVISKLQGMWQQDPGRISEIARQTGPQGFADKSTVFEATQIATLGNAFEQTALSIADTMEGGFGNQSRFPYAPQLAYLLERYAARPTAEVREVLETTLDAMGRRGLHDHVEGGFFRYTTDPSWSVPHFEKMLYDNAQLSHLYLSAADVLGREDYRAIGFATLDFMLARMAGDDQGFVASLSAVDDQQREGAFYLYDNETLLNTLTPEELQATQLIWSLPASPAFEFGHLLVNQAPVEVVAATLKLDIGQTIDLVMAAMEKLKALRDERILPVDSKRLAGWNALALKAFIEGAKQSQNPAYAKAARGIRDYLINTLWQGDQLNRALEQGRAIGTVSLSDYAYVAEALAEYGRWQQSRVEFEVAQAIARAAWRDFYEANGWRRETRSLLKGAELEETLRDETLPAPDAVLISLSLALAAELDDADLAEKARAAINRAYDVVLTDSFFYPSRIRALERSLTAEN